jgi:hypothetical protein
MYYKHLKLNIPPVLDLSVMSQLPDKGHVPINTSYINRDLIDFMYERDIRIKNADVFCSPPGFELGIHVDGTKLNNCVALNWAYCDEKGAMMQWWRPKSADAKVVDPSNVADAYGISTTPYALGWTEDEVDFITEVEVQQPTLVNIGVPHGMKNRTNSYRKALSLTWLYKNGDLEWDDAVELLGDLIED